MYTMIFLVSFIEIRRQRRRTFIDDYDHLNDSKFAPGVSLIVTAYNERISIVDSVRSYLKLQYPKMELIVVNDGSTDDTLDILLKEFKLKKIFKKLRAHASCRQVTGYYVPETDSKLIVIDKLNGGKADALNAGINAAHYPYFASLDGDSIIQSDALLKIMTPVFQNPNKVVGVGGRVRVANDCVLQDGQVKEVKMSRNPLVVFQILEYMRAFTAGRMGFSLLKSLPITSGAFSFYNTAMAREMGGYDPDAIGEDFEIIIRVHKTMREKKKDYEVRFKAYPVCWTEVPSTIRALAKQRNRWHRGLTSVLQKHESMLFNPKYGRIGLFSLPFFFLFEFAGPIIEAMGYIYILYAFMTGSVHWPWFFLFLGVSILWGTFLSMLAVLYEDLNFKWYKKWYHIAVLILFAVLENVSYRQMTVVWRLHGLFDYMRGDESWGSNKRKGFTNNHAGH